MHCGTTYVDLTHQTSQLDPEKVDFCGNILHSPRRSESQSENAAGETKRREKRKLSTPELRSGSFKDAYAFSSVLQCRVCCIVAFLFLFFFVPAMFTYNNLTQNSWSVSEGGNGSNKRETSLLVRPLMGATSSLDTQPFGAIFFFLEIIVVVFKEKVVIFSCSRPNLSTEGGFPIIRADQRWNRLLP